MPSGTTGSRDRKQFGKYYTPVNVARVLTNWAITHRHARVFDPSFGGCAFYEAAIETLSSLGNVRPGKQLHGVDVDPAARQYLAPAIAAGGSQEAFVTSDFLTVTNDRFLQRF